LAQYTDIYMRDFPGDTGQVPSTTRVAVSHSPDIIPAGVNPVSNYEQFYAGNYDGPYNYYSNIESGGSYNYIYTRGKNLYSGAQTGKVYLYYSPSSVLLLPSTWTNNRIHSANGTLFVNVSATANDDIVVGDAPFYWAPPPLQPGQGHYCLIAQVVTDEDPNPIPTDDNLRNFAQWVADSPGIAWRNVTLVNNLPTPSYQSMTGMQNPDDTSNLVTVIATCVGIPVGTTVNIRSTTSGPNPPINSTGTVDNTTKYLVSAVSELPANYKGDIQMTANLPPNTQPPFGASIIISYYVNVDADEGVAKRIGIEPEFFGLTSKDVGFASGGSMLLLGDYSYTFEVT